MSSSSHDIRQEEKALCITRPPESHPAEEMSQTMLCQGFLYTHHCQAPVLQGTRPIIQRAGTLPFQQMGINVEGKGTMYSIYFNYEWRDLESQLESCPFFSEPITNERLYHPKCAFHRISFQEESHLQREEQILYDKMRVKGNKQSNP